MVQMKFFDILLCIAVGSVFGELQRLKFGKEKLEVTEDDANEARSLISLDDGRKTYSSDESVRVKYALDSSLDQIAANTKDADSVEKETPRKPSSVIDTSTVKPTSFKSIKKNLEIKYLWRPATHFKMLRKTAKPKNTRSEGERKTLNDFFKSFLRGTDALSLKETNLARKERRVLRRKRSSLEDFDRPVKIVEDPTNIVESLKTYRKLRDKLPLPLRQQIRETDKFEEKLLKYYTKNFNRAPLDIYSPYYTSVVKERQIFFHIVADTPLPENEAWEIVDNYRSLRKGLPLWNFIGLRPSLQEFLNRTSESGYGKFMRSKHDELDYITINGILGMNLQGSQDSTSPAFSRLSSGGLLEIGSKNLTEQLKATDKADEKMLQSCLDTRQIPKNVVDAYMEERKKETQLFKNELASSGLRKQRLNEGYHLLRKGSIWYWMQHKYKDVFEKDFPCKSEYEAIKKQEGQTDQYLGSVKTEDLTKDENEKAEAFEKASSKTKSEKGNRKLRAEVAQVARAIEDEKAEEMERGVRAKETKTVEVEYDAYRENVENVVTTSDDAKEDVKVHGSSDNVTSADATNTETITDTKTKDNSHLLRFAILFAMVMQVIIAILILAPQRDKLVEWCKRKERTDSGPSETEPLQAGEKVFATGPTSKVLNVSSQRRPDVADANQRARV